MDAQAEFERELERAMQARSLVGQAMGIVMERFNIDSDAAFDYLRRASSAREMKLSRVAAELIETRAAPLADSPSTQAAHDPAAVGSTIRVAATGEAGQLLSDREREVLTLIARGASNQEISETLFLSLNTVKTYIRTAYRKIGVERRTHAVLWVQQHILDETAESHEPADKPL